MIRYNIYTYKVDMVQGSVRKCHFASDILFEWPLTPSCQRNYKDMGKITPIYDILVSDYTSLNSKYFFISVVYESSSEKLLLLVFSVCRIASYISLAQDTFDGNSNATTVQIARFLYIHMRRCFLSYNFILG